MLDYRTEATLQAFIRRESRSLLQYLADAFPWTTREEGPALAEFAKIAAEERQHAADAAKFLQKRRITVPYLGSYPASFTTMNFVSLDYLVPRLVQYEAQAIIRLERDLPDIKDADGRQLLERALEAKRRHLAQLSALVPASAAKPA